MMNMITTKLIALSAAFVFPLSALAVQPMTESDLEVVSAVTGSNILNIFGSSQAGLTLDDDSDGMTRSSVELKTEKYAEGEATKPIAQNKLRTIEEDNFKNLPQTQQNIVSNDSRNTILKLNESTKGSASAFLTDSEISYKNSNVNLDMRNIENGGIAISRDMQVDLLKLENLSGDNFESSRSVGNIYLSDWISRGDTRINLNQ